MTTATLSPVYPAGPGRLLRAEWTKIRSVRSTAWSLVILVVAAPLAVRTYQHSIES